VHRKQYQEHLEVQKDFPPVDFIGRRKAVFNMGANAMVVERR